MWKNKDELQYKKKIETRVIFPKNIWGLGGVVCLKGRVGTDVVVQQVNPPLVSITCHMDAGLRKQWRMAQVLLGTCTHVADLDKDIVSWLRAARLQPFGE